MGRHKNVPDGEEPPVYVSNNAQAKKLYDELVAVDDTLTPKQVNSFIGSLPAGTLDQPLDDGTVIDLINRFIDRSDDSEDID